MSTNYASLHKRVVALLLLSVLTAAQQRFNMNLDKSVHYLKESSVTGA